MKLSLVIDGHFLLHRLIYPLHNSNILYGELEKSLNYNLEKHLKLFPFEQIWFVSDSKNSWRKQVYADYKGTRMQNQDLDWEFIYQTYRDFKNKIEESNHFHLLESPGIEGDDWIYGIVKESNKRGIGCLVVSGDSDLHQLLSWNVEQNWLNIQFKDSVNHAEVYLPSGYKLFNRHIYRKEVDLFDLDWRQDYFDMLGSLEANYKVIEVDPVEALVCKMIQGDSGDNIPTLCTSYTTTGKPRGIGKAGAKKIFDLVKDQYGLVLDLEDPSLIDLIIEESLLYKKLENSRANKKETLQKLQLNRQLIELDVRHMPAQYRNIMLEEINRKIKV